MECVSSMLFGSFEWKGEKRRLTDIFLHDIRKISVYITIFICLRFKLDFGEVKRQKEIDEVLTFLNKFSNNNHKKAHSLIYIFYLSSC